MITPHISTYSAENDKTKCKGTEYGGSPHPVIQPHSSTVAMETRLPSSPVKTDVEEEAGAHVDF